MKVDPPFLLSIQRAGWRILYADEGSVWCGCPRDGCGVRITVKPGKTIPETCGTPRDFLDVPVKSFAQVRDVLMLRRQELCLSIPEVEDIAGLTADHVAKFEKPTVDRMPNVETLILWAGALGYRLVLVPTDLPRAAIRTLADTRDKVQDRRKKFAFWNRLRLGRRDAQDA